MAESAVTDASTPVRTCRCGCGTPLTRPGAAFVLGHNARVAPRLPGGGVGRVLPVRSPEGLPLCACGCGQRVRDHRKRWLPGHNNRVGAARGRLGASQRARGGGSWRTCPLCGRTQWVPRSQDDGWWGCVGTCGPRSRRKVRPWNRLQRRCFEYMAAHNLSLKAFARTAGVHPGTLRAWMANEGSTTSGDTLAACAAVLGISAADAVREAGGTTAEERRREVGRANYRRVGPALRAAAGSPTTREKLAAAHRGRPKTPEHIASIRAANKRSPNAEVARARLVAWHASLEGRVVRQLWPLLRNHPSPSPEQLQEQGARAAGRLLLPVPVVLAFWRPYLERRGLRPRVGRPPKVDRERRVAALMGPWPRKKNGALADGFWADAARRVSQDEGDEIDGPALKRWWTNRVAAGRSG